MVKFAFVALTAVITFPFRVLGAICLFVALAFYSGWAWAEDFVDEFARYRWDTKR